jgi:hypothetical protein
MAITRLGTYSQIKGSSYKLPCKVATSSSISLTGGAPLVVDGYTVATNDRVLAVSQSTATQNGIYVVQSTGSGANGTWVRAIDFSLDEDAFQGVQVFITSGSVNADKTYYLDTPDPITIDSTSLTFRQIPSGGTSSPGLTDTSGSVVNTAQSTTSNTYTDLATVGPSATVTIGPTGTAIVMLTAEAMTTSNGTECYMSFDAGGVTANDAQALVSATRNAGDTPNQSAIFWVTGLTQGSNTFTAKYKTTGGVSATFENRNLIVIPIY